MKYFKYTVYYILYLSSSVIAGNVSALDSVTKIHATITECLSFLVDLHVAAVRIFLNRYYELFR